MYKEKKDIIQFITDNSSKYGWDYTYEEKYHIASLVSQKLDSYGRVLTEEEFDELLYHNYGDITDYSNTNFDDEIVSIEFVGEEELYDIEVSDDSLFYANGILTHNSAVNNVDASNDSVSDSIGTVQTADFIVFLLQNEQMKAENVITCKCTKNRFTGRTDTWDMSVDYTHMRFSDLLVQHGSGLTEKDAEDAVNNIYKEDVRIIKEKQAQNGISEDDGFADIMKDLGIE